MHLQLSSNADQCATDSSTAVFPVRFLVQAMVLFKESLSQWIPVRKDGTESAQGQSPMDALAMLLKN